MTVDRVSILQHVLDDHPWNELANPGLCDLANAALESLSEDVGQYEMLREMTDSCPCCGGTGIEEVPERSHCGMCDGQGIVMLGTVADALRDARDDVKSLRSQLEDRRYSISCTGGYQCGNLVVHHTCPRHYQDGQPWYEHMIARNQTKETHA